MDQFISELHYYIREKLWHSAIKLCTEELQKGKDPFLGGSSMQIDRCLKERNDTDSGLYVRPAWSGSESLSLELHVTQPAGLLFISNSLNSAVWCFVRCFL